MRTLLLMLLAAGLAGCASNPLPVCDGKHRRPINASAQAGIVYPTCGTAAQGAKHEARATA